MVSYGQIDHEYGMRLATTPAEDDGPVVILDQHQIISAALAAFAFFSSFFRFCARNFGCRFGAPSQTPAVSS